MKGYYEDEYVFKYVDEFGIAQTMYKKNAPMFGHQRQPERLSETAQCIHEWIDIPTTEEGWCRKCGIRPHEVRCDSLNTANKK